jgi:hypothetical protein
VFVVRDMIEFLVLSIRYRDLKATVKFQMSDRHLYKNDHEVSCYEQAVGLRLL